MAKKEKIVFYDLTNILSKDCVYSIIYGERSNGKTYAVCKHFLEEYAESKKEIAIIRRFETEFTKGKGKEIFDNLIYNEYVGNQVEVIFKGRYNFIEYISGRWYLEYRKDLVSDKYAKKERIRGEDELENKVGTIRMKNPFAYAFALNLETSYKSGKGYPYVKNILFDEFITRDLPLINEFTIFQNLLSTIIRKKEDCKIFMCGNTINKYSEYFEEMGLNHVRQQKQGTIDVYKYGDTELSVAVEFSDSPVKTKQQTKYFAFDNPKIKMITTGTWEIDIYPHLPEEFVPKDVVLTYYIEFHEDILECKIIAKKDKTFTFIHRKTTPIKEDNTRRVYSINTNVKPNYRRNILKPLSKQDSIILSYFKKDKVFYQNNEIGNIVDNYLKWCIR